MWTNHNPHEAMKIEIYHRTLQLNVQGDREDPRIRDILESLFAIVITRYPSIQRIEINASVALNRRVDINLIVAGHGMLFTVQSSGRSLRDSLYQAMAETIVCMSSSNPFVDAVA